MNDAEILSGLHCRAVHMGLQCDRAMNDAEMEPVGDGTRVNVLLQCDRAMNDAEMRLAQRLQVLGERASM